MILMIKALSSWAALGPQAIVQCMEAVGEEVAQQLQPLQPQPAAFLKQGFRSDASITSICVVWHRLCGSKVSCKVCVVHAAAAQAQLVLPLIPLADAACWKGGRCCGWRWAWGLREGPMECTRAVPWGVFHSCIICRSLQLTWRLLGKLI